MVMHSPGRWREKLEKPQAAKVVSIPPKMQRRFGSGTMLIPHPLEVDALIRSIPAGKLVTQSQLRQRLAKDACADVSCPLTTGIFIRIAAETAEEDRRSGQSDITPYWRVIRDDGSLNEKFPGGVAGQAMHLQSEGQQIEVSAGGGRVIDFQQSLFEV